MRLRRSKPDHAEVLARTASLEMELGVGNSQDTLGQLNSLLDQMNKAHQENRSAEADLILRMRHEISRLQAVIHRRELEFDEKEAHIIRLREELARLGSTVT